MKISKSKRQLAQLLIDAGVTKFPEGANWAAQDKSGTVCIYAVKPVRDVGDDYWYYKDGKACSMYRYYAESPISNWHQTVLGREEFDQVVAAEKLSKHMNCSCSMRSTNEPAAAPTLDQLLQDWRNADDYAKRKQVEADEAAVMRDEQWKAVQDRACEMGVEIGRCDSVVVDTGFAADSVTWDDLLEGDEMRCVVPFGGDVNEGSSGIIRYKTKSKISVDFPEQRDYVYYKSHFDRGDVKFIRRP